MKGISPSSPLLLLLLLPLTQQQKGMINRETDYYLCVSLYPICFYYLVIIAADCSLGRPRGGKALASLDHFLGGSPAMVVLC